MNKGEFIEAVAARLSQDRKAAGAAVDAVIGTVYAAVAEGDRVSITGFGVFEKRERAARVARNPATGARVDVEQMSVPGFRPGAQFRAVVKGDQAAGAATAVPSTTRAPRAAAPSTSAQAGRTLSTSNSPAKKTTAAKTLSSTPEPVAASPSPAIKQAAKKPAAKAEKQSAKKDSAKKDSAKKQSAKKDKDADKKKTGKKKSGKK